MSWEFLADNNEASNSKNELRVPELAKVQSEQAVTAPVKQTPVVDAVVITDNGAKVVPTTSAEFISKFPGIASEMKAQAHPPAIAPSSTFAAFVGHEGNGKTGLAMDAHTHKHPEGLAIVLDHDNGGLSCKQAHYEENRNIRIFSPWVMQQEDRTAYNYLASYNRAMEIGKFAVEYAERQAEDGYEGQLLKTFIVTGVDQYDEMCINCMKIYDLDMKATDAVEASHAKLNQEIGWNLSLIHI